MLSITSSNFNLHMVEDNSVKKEPRRVLGDVTNQLGKRGFSSISSSPDNSVSKSQIRNKRSADPNLDEDDSHFWKQVSKAAESLEKERYGSPKCQRIVSQSGLSPLSGGKTYRLRTPSRGGISQPSPPNPNPAQEVRKPLVSGVDKLRKVLNLGDTVKESVANVAVVESSKLPHESCLEGGKDCQVEETVVVSDSGENDYTQETLSTKVVRDDGKTIDTHNQPSSQSEVVSSRLREVNDKVSYGLERCKLLKGDGCSSSAAGLDLVKSCSCSFCIKAAYIWSDLHYQDVKGRISVLIKSRKEANSLAQRYSGTGENVKHSEGEAMTEANLENDLTSQWKTLFVHMESIFASESGQLQTDLLSLKDLKEDFKNSESNSGIPSDIQQCSSSDASDRTII